jgi:hypothetical protein
MSQFKRTKRCSSLSRHARKTEAKEVRQAHWGFTWAAASQKPASARLDGLAMLTSRYLMPARTRMLRSARQVQRTLARMLRDR